MCSSAFDRIDDATFPSAQTAEQFPFAHHIIEIHVRLSQIIECMQSMRGKCTKTPQQHGDLLSRSLRPTPKAVEKEVNLSVLDLSIFSFNRSRVEFCLRTLLASPLHTWFCEAASKLSHAF
jgi:hypothetical protein